MYDRLSARLGRDALATSLSRDLAHLMNAATRGADLCLAGSQLESSVWNYGQPPLADGKSNQVDPMRVCAHIREAIRGFETRLDADSVEVRTRADSGPSMRQLLYFDITASIRGDGSVVTLCLALDFLGGFFMSRTERGAIR
ncbi:GPW/gp25 family protein [Chromobacterium sp. ATCC 53434]|uniref:GPW/gp25 family protein n=1 Tax=Chromobacterium sp. (strain ATCC 53434 / SC 14030) TaxID=2059672 RepID=UPI001305299D|nr:GPW/gp25 family protein [Chromobacterium sp. ATCC 53434]